MTPPPIICDHNTPGEALYLVLPDGFVMLDGEDSIPRWLDFISAPRCHEASEPKGPVVTRMELDSCDTCGASGRRRDGVDVEWDRDELGEMYRTTYPRMVDCPFCDGTGWRYDWGPNVALERIVAEVRGKAEVAA